MRKLFSAKRKEEIEMQKSFIIGLSLVFMISSALAYTPQESKAIIKGAIDKYKAKNYIGCISDLKLYTEHDASNAIAWYYLGNSYMKISMKEDATKAFDKAIELDTVPQVTSYSIQAKLCMEDPMNCKYQVFSFDDILKLKLDPKNFIAETLAPKVENVELPKVKNPFNEEINKLIEHQYGSDIHPEAQNIVDQEKLREQQERINAR